MKKTKLYSKLGIGLAGCEFYLAGTVKTYALGHIDNDVNAEKFSNMTLETAPGIILGICFWVLRIIGVICLISGIYNLTSCNKDGDADGINMAWVKVLAGMIFLAMPAILSAAHILE